MPSKINANRERLAMEAIEAGKTTAEAAVIAGVCLRTMHAIRRRNGDPAKAGRPSVRTPLSEEQSRLVEEYAEMARRIAHRRCRQYSQAPALDIDEYVSCAYLALVKAASRWMALGSFRTLSAVFIEGALRDYRRQEMRSNGWFFARGDGGGWRYVKAMERTSLREETHRHTTGRRRGRAIGGRQH